MLNPIHKGEHSAGNSNCLCYEHLDYRGTDHVWSSGASRCQIIYVLVNHLLDVSGVVFEVN